MENLEEKNICFRKSYFIVGSKKFAQLYVLSLIKENSDHRKMILGGPSIKKSAFYAYEKWDSGEIKIYVKSDSIEEIHVQKSGTLSVYIYDKKNIKLSCLYDEINELRPFDDNNRLILKNGVWYLNNIASENKLGEKVAANLYLMKLSPKSPVEDTLIIGDSFCFGEKDMCLISLDEKAEKIITYYKDYIKTEDGYVLMRRKDLFFDIYKNAIKQTTEQIITHICNLPVEFSSYNDGYLLEMFGEIILKGNIETSANTDFSHKMYSTIKVQDVENVFHTFYHIKTNKENKNELLPKEQVVLNTRNLSQNIDIFQRFENFYALDKEENKETFLGQQELIHNLFCSNRYEREDFVDMREKRQYLFNKPCMIVAFPSNSDKPYIAANYKSYTIGEDEEKRPAVFLELQKHGGIEIYYVEGENEKLVKSNSPEKQITFKNERGNDETFKFSYVEMIYEKF